MDFVKSLAIAASGLRAQAGRMRVLSENIANADSKVQGSGADPYRRRIPIFRSEMDRALGARGVGLGPVRADMSDFRVKHEPRHPSAGAAGNVSYASVNPLIDMTTTREAQRSYEASVNIIGATRRMIQRTLDILRA